MLNTFKDLPALLLPGPRAGIDSPAVAPAGVVSGTCLFMIWTALGCLDLFINTIVWRHNVTNWSPIWCDISSHIVLTASVGSPASSLCINRRLYNIATCQTVSMTKALKRRAVMVDLAIALGLLLLQLPLRHRYDIIENVGCYPTTYNVVPAYPLSYLLPNIFGLVSATYALLTLRAFLQRAQFATLLTNNSALTPNRYFRLMALASLELLFNIPLSSYGLYLSASREPINPWVSWANTHADFGFVGQVPAILWRSDPHTRATVELSRWAGVICALVFFAFFGFAAEARKHYALAFWAVAKRLGFTPPANGALPFPWRKARLSASATAAQSGTTAVSFPLTPQKLRHDSLSASLADTSTDFDDVDIKGDSAPPSPASSAAPEYTARDVLLMGPRIGDVEMGRREIAPGAYTPHAFPTPEHVELHNINTDIELGAYTSSPASASSRSLRTLDNARPRPHVPDAFFPSGSSSSSRSSHASSSSSSSSSSTNSSPVSLHATLPPHRQCVLTAPPPSTSQIRSRRLYDTYASHYCMHARPIYCIFSLTHT
ncbi:pheromone A receptor-domain-containing protein [Mycena rebaudengoi]|nr:pheromone A receptor-domain-containing protein [Mycena rebaudengoi]